MFWVKSLSAAFAIILTAAYPSGDRIRPIHAIDRNLPGTDHYAPAADRACDMYILLSPDGILKKEGNAIKIKNFKRDSKRGDFSIKLDNNEQTVLENQKVWGYQDRNCFIYRNFNNDFLRMEENGSLIIYSTSSIGFRGELKIYYFSKTLQGPVFKLDRNNIAEQFKDNACFLSNVIKRLGCPGDYADWDAKKSSFAIVEIMNECR